MIGRQGEGIKVRQRPVSKARHPIYPTRHRVGLVNSKARTQMGAGFPLWVGGELLSHGLPQYHRRGGA